MKKLFVLPFLLFAMCSFKQNPENKEDIQSEKAINSQEWIQLFNGKDLADI